MVAKKKYYKVNIPTADETQMDQDNSLTRKENEISARANLVYDKSDKSLDMGRFKATEYKFNRYTFTYRSLNL